MFSRLCAAAGLVLASVVAANAVTIQPGQTFEAAYSVSTDEIDTAANFPILSIDGPILYVQYYHDFPDLAPGGQVTISQLGADRSLFGEYVLENTSASPGTSGGSALSCSFCVMPTSGFVQVRNDSLAPIALGGTSHPTGLEFLLSVAATVDVPNTGPFPTSISFVSPISGFALVTTEEPPVDPPNVIPLPASAWLLALGVAGLAGMRRRQV